MRDKIKELSEGLKFTSIGIDRLIEETNRKRLLLKFAMVNIQNEISLSDLISIADVDYSIIKNVKYGFTLIDGKLTMDMIQGFYNENGVSPEVQFVNIGLHNEENCFILKD